MDNLHSHSMKYDEWSKSGRLTDWLNDEDTIIFYHSSIIRLTITKHVCGRYIIVIALAGDKDVVMTHFDSPEEVYDELPIDETKLYVTHQMVYLLSLYG